MQNAQTEQARNLATLASTAELFAVASYQSSLGRSGRMSAAPITAKMTPDELASSYCPVPLFQLLFIVRVHWARFDAREGFREGATCARCTTRPSVASTRF